VSEGIGVLIYRLGGGNQNEPAKYVGRTIDGALIVDNKLVLSFSDQSKIAIWDNGQSCCENRYMSTDDDLMSLVGRKLTRIEAKSGPEQDGGDMHETCFVEIGTDDGFVTLVNHNEPNGYYGGFGLTITEVDA